MRASDFAVTGGIAFTVGVVGYVTTAFAVGQLSMSAGDWIQSVALITVVIGWLVSHRMTLTAQRAHFRDQLIADARGAVVSMLHQEHMALNYAVTALGVYAFNRNASEPQRREMPARLGPDVDSRLRDTGKCAKTLREFEPMFPETAIVREELVAVENALRRDIRRFFDERNPRLRAFEEAEDLVTRTFEMMGYFDDLRVFVQNKSLSQIMRYEVPYRSGRIKPDIKTLQFDAGGRLRLPEAVVEGARGE